MDLALQGAIPIPLPVLKVFRGLGDNVRQLQDDHRRFMERQAAGVGKMQVNHD
jgi:hypothetical protein